jgi:hypothetical protein
MRHTHSKKVVKMLRVDKATAQTMALLQLQDEALKMP